MDGDAVVIADDQRFLETGGKDLAVVDDVRGGELVRYLSARQLRVLQAQQGLNVRHSHAVAVQLRRRYIHAHRRVRRSAHAYLPYALDLRELLLEDRRGGFVHDLFVVFLRGQAQNHDRSVRRIDLAIGRVTGQ